MDKKAAVESDEVAARVYLAEEDKEREEAVTSRLKTEEDKRDVDVAIIVKGKEDRKRAAKLKADNE